MLGRLLLKLFHRDLGGAATPLLILLHGMLGSSRNGQSAGADLAAHFHVLALDLRNHGRSPHAPTMSYEQMKADVRAWVDAQRTGAATITGHSMGGKVGILLACRKASRARSNPLWRPPAIPGEFAERAP